MNYLLITLGHNSSAIFVDNDRADKKPIVIGYEQERFSKLKADSQFPIDAINEIIYNVGIKKLKQSKCLVSHWFNLNEGNMPNKYITYSDLMFLKDITAEIKFVDKAFTHHDAHMMSAYAFYKYFVKYDTAEPVYYLVADGFGNNEEVISLYVKISGLDKPCLIKKVYGYEHSLGLMYQYATSYTGMKENQDEYKFLGYEAHINECLSKGAIDTIAKMANEAIEVNFRFAIRHEKTDTIPPTAISAIDFSRSKLEAIKIHWHSHFSDVLDKIGIDISSKEETSSFAARVAIAFYIQRIVETTIKHICKNYAIKNLCCAGGLFYNVKLNNTILNSIDGRLCVMPLAGDQGAAIGMYANEPNAPQFPFDTLAIGPRRLYNIEKYIKATPGAELLPAGQCAYRKIAYDIANGKIVNLVFGNMEFGPRALCNTSSIFLPSASNVAKNNHNNARNEVMPCAPVCIDNDARALFEEYELDRIIGSTNFMICTCTYKKQYSNVYGGVMHKIPEPNNTTPEYKYSGRPQIISSKAEEGTHEYAIREILKNVKAMADAKCLVNTSFNTHGQPIVFDTADIVRNFKIQRENAYEPDDVKLYILV